jgi:phosphoribosylformylglycinamidine (FGAM) synthase PurS component
MPQFGTAPQPDPAAIPVNARAAQYLPQQQTAPAPETQAPGFMDRLGAGLGGFAGANGPLDAISNLVGGFATGQRQDSRGIAQQSQKAIYDPVTQVASVFPSDRVAPAPGSRLAEVWPKKGVSDPVAGTVVYAAQDLGVAGLSAVRSGQVYDFFGAVSPADVKRFCEEHLMNAMIQSVEVL